MSSLVILAESVFEIAYRVEKQTDKHISAVEHRTHATVSAWPAIHTA